MGSAFHWPAMMASISLMVPERHLTRVQGLDQRRAGALNIVAPPMAALLLSLLPLHHIMAIGVVTAVIAISSLLFVQIPQPERVTISPAEVAKPSLLEDAGQGLAYVRRWPGLLALLVMAALPNFVGTPTGSLVPLLITKHFGGQALQLGWMSSGWGIGLVLGGLVLSAWGGFRRRLMTALLAVVGGGLSRLVIGLAPATAFWLALAGVLLGGIMNPIINGPIAALLQAVVPPDMQGRVFTVLTSLAASMRPLGLAVGGPVADALGVRAWFVVSGVVSVLMAVAASRVPAIMGIEKIAVQGERTQTHVG